MKCQIDANQQLPVLLFNSVLKSKAGGLASGQTVSGLAVKQEGMGAHSAQAELKAHRVPGPALHTKFVSYSILPNGSAVECVSAHCMTAF